MSNEILNEKPKTFAIGGSDCNGDGLIDGMTRGFVSQISRFKLTFKQVKKI
jgi:hypothetical protein